MNADFLENYSLFRRFTFNVPDTLDRLPHVPIHMFCSICKSEQTFNMINRYHEFFNYSNAPSANAKLRLVYQCQSCKKFERLFFVYIDPHLKYAYKIGQYPEWEIKIEKQIEKALGKHSTNFRKGLVCESQAYGIGAFAYYRRIIEEIIDELLESISDIIPNEDKEKYNLALEQTKKTRVTQDKIEIIKDLLPAILKPNGVNPLGVLHSELSEGIHNLSDADCLERAEHIKNVLIFLLNQIIHTKNSASAFSESMKKLLDRRGKQSL
ncbi:hypothetical protein AAFN85_28585 [Mucilaginibacter sp. CAU 1740]|uniref:hypothetical protein n=1 Tax=Mucilaginibacter sp. CAU 1740 TaxID=3140365 RepID=UPI00325C02B0